MDVAIFTSTSSTKHTLSIKIKINNRLSFDCGRIEEFRVVKYDYVKA